MNVHRLSVVVALSSLAPPSAAQLPERWVLHALGDSLSHGTMDATNNRVHTENAYLERVAQSLDAVVRLRFEQPYFDFQEQRIAPFRVPTNFAVDGADVFSIEGIEYFERVGAAQSFVTESYLCERFLPTRLDDSYDRVLYPINLLARRPVSQVGAAETAFARNATSLFPRDELVVYWIGNNDTSLATLGSGGSSPTFLSFPFEESKAELTPLLRTLIEAGLQAGELSLEPYTVASIERNMTDTVDFDAQVRRTLGRLVNAPTAPGVSRELFVLTLPYYTAVGYLFDSEDLEYYLQKLDPSYQVPPTFARIAPVGQPITDPFAGDRVSLLTFGFLYTLLSTGSSVADVNAVLEQNGLQQDGLVLSEAELRRIMDRTDEYNQALASAAAGLGPNVHLVDVGQFLVDALTGASPIVVGGRTLSRKWVRGSALSLDGVHPAYAAQAAIANFVLAHVNAALGLAAPLHDLDAIAATDPYVDRDGDGFAPGPSHPASGLTEVLHLLRDPDDTNAAVEPVFPPDVWTRISNAILGQVLASPAARAAARAQGVPVPAELP